VVSDTIFCIAPVFKQRRISIYKVFYGVPFLHEFGLPSPFIVGKVHLFLLGLNYMEIKKKTVIYHCTMGGNKSL